MLWIPGGSFTMGCTVAQDNGSASFGETQQVTLTGYWIYENPVTVAQYRAFCTATGYAQPHYPGPWLSWVGTDWTDSSLQQMPIVNVTWNDCKAYTDWAGVKLPTEAQWEYSARGPSGNNYPWGGTATAADPYNGWDQMKCANYYNPNSVGKSTWPVGSSPEGASWCGAQNMAGNVWEWCADWYSNYATTPVINPTGPATGSSYRVRRGGSWYSSHDNDQGRGASRGIYPPNDYYNDVGFRCVSLSPGP